MFGIGMTEMILIAAVALVVIGPKSFPIWHVHSEKDLPSLNGRRTS